MSISGNLESLLGHLLAYLTQSSSSVTMVMFQAVSSTDAQRAMLTAAAEEKLRGAELEEFRDMMQEFKTRYGERSRLVHNCWGESPQHPDKAIWIASKDSARLSSLFASVTDAEQGQLLLQAPEMEIWRKCSTYTVSDLEAVHERMAQFTERFRKFVYRTYENHPVWQAVREGPAASAEQAIKLPPD